MLPRNLFFLKFLKNWMRIVIGDIGGAVVAVSSISNPSWGNIIGGAIGASIGVAATL